MIWPFYSHELKRVGTSGMITCLERAFHYTSGSHPQTSKLRRSMQSSRESFAVCAVEVLRGIYLQEMKSVLERIHRGISERSDISYSAGPSAPSVHAPKVKCLFHITPMEGKRRHSRIRESNIVPFLTTFSVQFR
jgi:hypothetical protein